MVEKLMKGLSKSGAIKVLKTLKNDGKRLMDIVRETNHDKATIWRRLEEFERELYLVEVEYDRSLKAPIYKLTPLGLKILSKLEEIEQIFEEEMKKAPPKGREFLGD